MTREETIREFVVEYKKLVDKYDVLLDSFELVLYDVSEEACRVFNYAPGKLEPSKKKYFTLIDDLAELRISLLKENSNGSTD